MNKLGLWAVAGILCATLIIIPALDGSAQTQEKGSKQDINQQIQIIKQELEQRLPMLRQQLEQVVQGLAHREEKMGATEANLSQRLDALTQKVDSLEQRLDSLTQRLEALGRRY